MAEENTIDSTPTTEAPQADLPSSTTEAPTADGGTLLTKSGDDAAPDTPSADGEPDPRAAFYGAPEGDDAAYELAGLPEGIEIDAEALAAVSPIAKELNLSNEGLSKIAGVYAEKVLPSVVERVNNELQQNITATRADWATQSQEAIKSDPTFEGKGLDDVRKVSAKALDRFGGEKFREYLDETGLGDHPAMLKFAYQAGMQIAEDTTFERGGSATTPKSSVEKFYGTS